MEKIGFGTVNWIVMIVYLLAMLGVGAYFTKRSGKDSDAFFKAGGNIPAWAAGFSIYATTLSAITFMSTPEKSFLGDWTYAAGNLAIIAIVPLLILFYIPFYRKLNVTTAYEYLEERFSVTLRLLGSLLFILFHIGRVAIVVYLPTLAISSISTINPYVIAAAVGFLCVIYTFLGGMEGVIWSDVIQGIILLFGAVLVIIFAVFHIDGGFMTVFQEAARDHKIVSTEDFRWSFAQATLPIIFLGSIFNSLHQYTASQDVVQRYNTTANLNETKRSLWTNAFLALITIPIFYGIGTVLYSYYGQHPLLPEGFNTSALVPYFVLTTLPAGVAGLIIAAIFAAAQSTISSSLNSMSACVVVDFKERFQPDTSEKSKVQLARAVIIITGILGVLAALYLVNTDARETLDLFLSLVGLFGVPIAGTFALGIFTKRANAQGALIGLIVSAIACFFLQRSGMISFFFSLFAFASSFGVGYLASLIFPNGKKKTAGLTIFTMNEALQGPRRP